MTLALDIGATNTRIALVSKTKLSKKTKFPTPKTKKEIMNKVFSLISSYKNFSEICVSVAGFEYKGEIQGALNMDLNDVSLKRILEKKFSVQVKIQNDARCAALAELKYGAGKNLNNFVLLTLGTGIGGAIVINKKLYLGNGTAGEIGSMYLNEKIFEHLASGTAVKILASEKKLKTTSPYELDELAKRGNKEALSIFKEIGHNLGIGLANLSYTLAPEAFILGGGFSEVKHFFQEAEKTLHSLYEINPKPKISTCPKK